MRKTDAASITLVAWMLSASGLLYLFHAPDLKLFLTIALVGFFIIVYVIHPTYSKPRSIRNVHLMATAGAVLFGLVIILRILELVEYWGL